MRSARETSCSAPAVQPYRFAEVSTNKSAGGELCVLARWRRVADHPHPRRWRQLFFLPSSSSSGLRRLAKFILIRCIRIEVDFSLNFVRGSVDVLVFTLLSLDSAEASAGEVAFLAADFRTVFFAAVFLAVFFAVFLAVFFAVFLAVFLAVFFAVFLAGAFTAGVSSAPSPKAWSEDSVAATYALSPRHDLFET